MLYVVQAQDFTCKLDFVIPTFLSTSFQFKRPDSVPVLMIMHVDTITDPLIISLIEVGAALVIASCPAVTGLFDYKGEGQDSASSLPDEEPGAVEDEDSESDSDITKPLLA